VAAAAGLAARSAPAGNGRGPAAAPARFELGALFSSVAAPLAWVAGKLVGVKRKETGRRKRSPSRPSIQVARIPLPRRRAREAPPSADIEEPRRGRDETGPSTRSRASTSPPLFEAKFGKQSVSGYRPFLREPRVESTGGGAQAVQHMVMEPQLEGDPTLTVGYVNVATKTAKVRTYGCLPTAPRDALRPQAVSLRSGPVPGLLPTRPWSSCAGRGCRSRSRPAHRRPPAAPDPHRRRRQGRQRAGVALPARRGAGRCGSAAYMVMTDALAVLRPSPQMTNPRPTRAGGIRSGRSPPSGAVERTTARRRECRTD